MVRETYNEKFERIKTEVIKCLMLSNKVLHEQELYNKLGITKSKEKKALKKILNKLVLEDSIVYSKKQGFIRLKTTEYEIGEVILNGINDFAVQFKDKRLSVRSKNLKGAYVGDKVLFSNKDKKVKSVLKKENNPRIFECIRVNDSIQIIPFNSRDDANYKYIFDKPISLSGDEILSAYVTYNEKEDYYECRIKEIIGSRTESSIYGKIVLASNGIDINFSEKALKEAELIPDRVLDIELKDRVDLRSLLTYSIDGNKRMVTIDDAISIEEKDNGNIKVYLHVIDVPHYIKPGSALFNEARKRSKKIYMHSYRYNHDMIPPKLSEGICSLKAGEDRLCKTFILEFDKYGKFLNYDFCNSVVNVNKNYSHEEANKEYLDVLYSSDDPNSFISLESIFFNSLHKANIAINRTLFKNEPYALLELSSSIMTNIIKIVNENVAHNFLTLPFIYKTFKYPSKKDIINKVKEKPIFYFDDAYWNFTRLDTVEEILAYYDLPRTVEYRDAVLELLSRGNYFFSTRNNGHFGLATPRYAKINSPARSFINLVDLTLFDLYSTEYDTDESYISRLEQELETICDEYNRNNEKYKKLEELSPNVALDERPSLDGLIVGKVIEKKGDLLTISVKNGEIFKSHYREQDVEIGSSVIVKKIETPENIKSNKVKVLRHINTNDNI
ncbi:MAG: RNB domain-containing ribonuclease [Bacilli bacterium]|nr:RNB domain-containing ribonuclease [Bacilli bacterium]